MRTMWSTSVATILLVAHLFFIAVLAPGFAATKMPADSSQFPAYSPAELLIQFKSDLRLNSAAWSPPYFATGFSGLDSLNALFHVKKIVCMGPDTLTGNHPPNAIKAAPIYLFKFEQTDNTAAAMEAYRKLSIVEQVEFNHFYFTNPQWAAIQAEPDKIHLPAATPFAKKLQSLLIGVIDTGFDWKAASAVSDIWTNPLEKTDRKDNDQNGLIDDICGYNFVNRDLLQQFGRKWESKPDDDCGHGTQVAQIISQIANFGSAEKKPYDRSQLMILKAGFQLPSGRIVFSTLSLLRAIQYAIDHGANIIHLSCSGSYPSRFLQQAIQRAVKSGCLVVAAAGDDNSRSLAYPAAFEEVLAVAAIDLADKKMTTSNYGDWIDLAAPGYALRLSANSPIASPAAAGSAIAAAYVSGLAALLQASNGSGTVEAVKHNLIWSCSNIYPENPDLAGLLGAGKIHATRALQKLYLPNILVTRIAGYFRHSRDLIDPATLIPITVSFRNMSFAATDLRLRIAVDDSIGCVLQSELQLAEQPFLHEHRNRLQPLLLRLNRPWPAEQPIPVRLMIETANGFSLTQTVKMPIENAAGITLSLVSEQPLTLAWTADFRFAGYYLYRKTNDQQLFERLNAQPMIDSKFVDYAAAGLTEASYFVVGVDTTGLESLPSDTVVFHARENPLSPLLPTTLVTDRPKVRVAFIPTDTLLTMSDSVRLQIQIDSSQSDWLNWQWRLNDKILEQHHGPALLLPAVSLQSGNNTIEVNMSGPDTTITHRWTVRVQPIFAAIKFSPGPDTTIYEGDSLRLAIHAPGAERLLETIKWQIHGWDDTTHTSFEYDFKPDFSAAGRDSIVVRFMIGDSVHSHCWRIHILNRNRPPIISSYANLNGAGQSVKDTLRVWVQAQDPDGDSLAYHWYFNQALDATQVDSFFVFHGLRSQLKSDTLMVRIADRDTAITHFWLLPMRHKNQPPQIINCTPSPTERLSTADSIRFHVLSLDADDDSLTVAWYLNGQLDSSAHQATYLYRHSPDRLQNDTILVSIADADTVVALQWIVLATSDSLEATPQPQLTWFPALDSVSVAGDSALFAVHHRPDEATIQWAINDSLIKISADSIFVYRPSNPSGLTDTVLATISWSDSVVRHAWIVHFLPISDRNNWTLRFQPDTSIVVSSPDDSICFSVQIWGAPVPGLSFRWQVNGEIRDQSQDSLFWYFPRDTIASKPDTILLQISIMDTSIRHQWVVLANSVRSLPAPRLLAPIKAEFMLDEDKLIWENDSSLSAAPVTAPWQYVVQIAADSNFLDIISSDTCTSQSLVLNKCSGFDKLPPGKAFCWRVKLFAANRYHSNFRKAARLFFYYPQFSQVENLLATIQEDGAIELSWTNLYDKNCAGFNLYRSESPQNIFIKINDQLITGKASFSFVDLTAQAGVTYNYKLEEVSQTGKKKIQKIITVTAPRPESYFLYKNFPNPFNSMTSFKYEIPTASYVTIEVYNVLGKKLRTLVDGFKEAGIYTVYWDGKDDTGQNVVSGVYFYHMATAKYNMTHKMIVVR